MQKSDKILVILTGGTICSFEKADGKRTADVDTARYKIVANFRGSDSPFKMQDFDFLAPLDILSENMTIDTWNILLGEFKDTDKINGYKGVIILHGTDTLAYTSSLLSVMLTALKVPVILVSSQLPLTDVAANGNANFKAAVELIMNGIAPNVYAVYRNSDGKMYLHYGENLNQCGDYSDDFFSKDMAPLENALHKGKAFKKSENLLEKCHTLKSGVLLIKPFVGLDYEYLNLDKISAVVHGTYHSQSVCVEKSSKQNEITNYSILTFLEKCKAKGVDLFLAPCDENSFCYESTKYALESGAMTIGGKTIEMAYIKTLIGHSMGLHGEDLSDFINNG